MSSRRWEYRDSWRNGRCWALRKLATLMLEERGFTVMTAVDGLEGVETFREHADEILLVLLDMTMPRMSGEEAFKIMHELRPDTPIVLCSGYTAQEASSRFAEQN